MPTQSVDWGEHISESGMSNYDCVNVSLWLNSWCSCCGQRSLVQALNAEKNSYFGCKHVPRRLHKILCRKKVRASLACTQNIMFIYILVLAFCSATNKTSEIKTVTILGFARRPKKRSCRMVRRGKVDWLVCQIRWNDSNKLTCRGEINNGCWR